MKIHVLFAALAVASLAAVPAAAHNREACGQRPSVHRAASHHAVRRAPVRHLATRSVQHRVRYAAACGCGHADRARTAYGERFYRPHAMAVAAYYEPRPIFYRPRMIVYREDFPIRRFHERGFHGRGFDGGYYRHRDFDRGRDWDFGRRRFAMNDGWRR